MKPRQPLTPARSLYVARRLAVHLDPPADTSRLPPLARDGDGAGDDATDAWLAHIAAGRISVR